MGIGLKSPEYHIAENRTVFTAEIDGWPAGVVTGHAFLSPFAKNPKSPRQKRTFYVEHIIVLPGSPPNTLLNTVSAGLKAARDLGYDDLVLFIHDDHPLRGGLVGLAHRYTFESDAPHDEGAYYRKALR